ncbi:MAG: prepilin-type N-terminal cleavage/methylation domain-containing protein [Verrucomicrobiales bacterium]|nr:prepilin-type N-terminal cleavage/methylation domain-containing protein [Verrucomicrobiales bacterium]
MSFIHSNSRVSNNCSGFSLLELMVVLGVMGLLLAMSVPALLTARSVSLDTAARNAGAFFEVARSRAVTLGRPVRVMIHDKPGNSGYFRQKLIRAVGAGNGTWEVEGTPLLLPPDVVFDASSPDAATLRMEYAVGRETPHFWRYYEIGADGTMGERGRNFVIASGNAAGGRIFIPDPDAVRGFRISRNARLLYFRKADDIEEVLK